MAALSFPRRLLKENVVLLLVAMLVIMPLLEPFTYGTAGRALRNGLFQGIGVLLFLVLLARVELPGGSARLRYLARSGVNAPLVLFLMWAALDALRAPDRAFAAGELLRLGFGALIYFAAALHLESRAQLALLVDCLMGVVIFITGYGFFVQGSEAATGLSSVFANRMSLSAILAVLFPLLAALALGMQERGRRVVAIVAAILCGLGLLICLERSSWIGVAVGLLVLVTLARRSALTAPRSGSWRATLVVVASGLLVTAGFLFVTGVDATVTDRAQQISTAAKGRDASFAVRVHKWQTTAVMAAKRPLWGWGPGQYVLVQYPYTHLGLPPADIRRGGASFDDMAYNEYLQTAAELGFPGLALYLLILVSFFSKAARALGRLPDGLRRTVLLGCMAGVAAQMVDAVSNPAWRYMECGMFFWLILGLGVAVIRMAYQPAEGRRRVAGEESFSSRTAAAGA